jgi:hypothetical protein
MKSISKVLLLPLFACLISSALYDTSPAQTQIPDVSVRINISEYEVMFLADFFDVKTDQLSSLSSGFSVDLADKREAKGSVKMCLYVEVQVQLRGGNGAAGNDALVRGYTQDFDFLGSRTFASRDFARGGIVSPSREYTQNIELKKKIRDMALTNSTAPPGSYKIIVKALPAGGTLSSQSWGGDVKIINVVYATSEEAFIEINEPKTGSYFNNLAPTFSWTSAEPNVTVRVYEAGLNHRSPQDALTGTNPYLEQKVVRANTLTYPASAARQLQEGRAYVLQIGTEVSSSRGPLKNQSQPVVFRITNDNLGKILDNFMNVVPGDVSAAYSTLRAEPSNWIPWSLYGNITLDGAMLSESDLQMLLKELATQHNVKLELSIENQ